MLLMDSWASYVTIICLCVLYYKGSKVPFKGNLIRTWGLEMKLLFRIRNSELIRVEPRVLSLLFV